MSDANRKFAFSKGNYIILTVGILLIIAGFFLMAGPGSTDTYFNPDIYSIRRIKVAPTTCLLGFVLVLFSIIYNPIRKTK